jgi:hypothetical protein
MPEHTVGEIRIDVRTVVGLRLPGQDWVDLCPSEARDLLRCLQDALGEQPAAKPNPLPLHLRVWQPPAGASADPTLTAKPVASYTYGETVEGTFEICRSDGSVIANTWDVMLAKMLVNALNRESTP